MSETFVVDEKGSGHDASPKEMQHVEHERPLDEKTGERVFIDKDNFHAFKGDDSDGKLNWTIKKALAAASLGCLYSASQIMLYFVGASISFISADLNIASKASWLPVSYTLALTAACPFVGYLQDLLGRRNICLGGIVIVMVGIALVGAAHSFAQAIVGMVLAGAGAGICELTALAGVSDIVPVRRRGVALALTVLCILPWNAYVMWAQLLATRHSWRWSMWICLMWLAIPLIGLVFTWFPKSHPRMEGLSRRTILKRLDYVGAALSIIGLTLFLVALQAGGYTHPWTSAYVLTQLIIGLLLIIAWIVWEWRYAKFPVIPHEMFQGQRIVGLAFVIAFVSGVNMYSLINFFPLSFSAVYNPSPIQVGLKGIAYSYAVTIGAATLNSALSTKIPARYILIFAATIMTAFGGALVVCTPETPRTAVALGTISSFGVGGIFVPAATVALIAVPDDLLATTAALSLSIRTIGGGVGYSIYYNIFVNKLTKALPEYVAEYAIAAGLSPSNAVEFVTVFLTTPQNITSAPGYSPEVLAGATNGSRWAYSYALKYVWYTSIPFGLLAIICCAFMPSIRKYQTNRVAVQL